MTSLNIIFAFDLSVTYAKKYFKDVNFDNNSLTCSKLQELLHLI